MSEPVIADFVGKFNAENTPRGEPIPGRILLSQKRLVLAADGDNRIQIPLSAIFDVAVGHIPPDLGDFFDATVTIAFERGEGRYIAAVEADEEKIEKFSRVLFKAILNGTETTVKHPARRGGLVTDAEFVPSGLAVEPGVVRFANDRRTVEIELERVIGFDRASCEVGGDRRTVLVVRHTGDGRVLTTLVATQSPRKMAILGRYLRLEYADLLGDLADVELTTEKTELLVAVYSGGAAGVSLADVLDVDASQVATMLDDLEADGLVVDADEGTELTREGRVVVSNRLDDVDD